jgi:hypothetical protein
MTNEINIVTERCERCEVVVDSHEVEMYSQRGYRTIEIREEDIATIQNVNDNQMFPGNSYPTSFMKQVPVTLRVLRFHMVRDGESRIAELSVILEASQAECAAQKAEVLVGDKVIASLKSENERLTRVDAQHLANLVEEKKVVADLRTTLRKTEELISKIRKEIGEHRWREMTFDPSDRKVAEAEKARIASLDLDVAEIQIGSR